MTIYLLNALPNSLISCYKPTVIIPTSAQTVAYGCSEADYHADFDDNIPPRVFNATSAIGHESTAYLFQAVFEAAIDAHHAFQPLRGYYKIPVNRTPITPIKGDTVFCGLFTPPRRLAEGSLWTEAEILSMPINWVYIDF
ncbi:MAG: hypothetical protein IM613_12040 [Cytophagales bacterium]|jgi:hypothetical protein|nr:hypothetical protein [Cytophagales bacterium]